MIQDVKKGQYVWFVIPQELSWYPVVLGARVEETSEYGMIEVRWQYPHAMFEKDRLYSTKKKARAAAVEVLRQKVERMKTRTVEMERHIDEWIEKDRAMCVCSVCDVDEYTIHQPCIQKAIEEA